MSENFKPDTQVGYRHEKIGRQGCPYMERWLFGIGIPGRPAWFHLRLHHFFDSDEMDLHDHPFAFLTLVLQGSYEDWIECPKCHGQGASISLRGDTWHAYRCSTCGGRRQVMGTKMTPGKVRFRPALHKHRVVTDGCWTLVLSGPKVRDWGFYPPEGFLRQRAYFKKHGGHAACE